MTRPVIQAPPERLAYLRELQRRKQQADAARLSEADAFRAIGYEPICKPRVLARLAVERGENILVPEPCGRCPQEQFHRATEDAVLYGGSAGGGKSAALVAESIRVAVRYPGIRVLVLRRSYDELAESIYPEYRRFNWAEVLGGKWNKTDKEITFPNGSLIRLRYMETSDDASRRQGGAYQLLLVDELTLMPPGVVATIANERLRSAHGVPVLGLRASSNPGGASHGEVKSRYVDATEQGTKVCTDDNGLTVRFIKAKATDNPYLDEGYYRRLDAIPDPARRAAMRDGDWGQFAGQMFGELRWERHTCDPIELPVSWKRYMGVDWGFAKPWAVCWAAVDPDGRVWMYREIYQTGVGETDQALKILASEDDHEYIAARWADDSMWNKLGDARPIADVYAANGVMLTPAGKSSVSRIHGWQRWHSYLEEAPACPMHRAEPFRWETCPKVHMFRTLPKMWWELSNLPHSPRGNPEDADTAAPDHLCDASRYLLVNLGGEARFHFPAPDPQSGQVPRLDPVAAGPDSYTPRPLPASIGGFPRLEGDDPWYGLMDR